MYSHTSNFCLFVCLYALGQGTPCMLSTAVMRTAQHARSPLKAHIAFKLTYSKGTVPPQTDVKLCTVDTPSNNTQARPAVWPISDGDTLREDVARGSSP